MRKFQYLLFSLKRLYLSLYNLHDCTFEAIIKFNHKKMQLCNYQDVIYQYIVYARKKIDIFMKCLYSRLDSPYD